MCELHSENSEQSSNKIRSLLATELDVAVSHRTVFRGQHACSGRHLTKIVVQKVAPKQVNSRLLGGERRSLRTLQERVAVIEILSGQK